jgi:hypothetical protein
LRATTLTTGKL